MAYFAGENPLTLMSIIRRDAETILTFSDPVKVSSSCYIIVLSHLHDSDFYGQFFVELFAIDVNFDAPESMIGA